MGAEASQPARKAATSALRVAGEPLNTLGYPIAHERVYLPVGKPVRQTVCRCWQSHKFPLCDNTHQRLQKIGCNVGPAMLEIKPGLAPISANGSGSATATPVNLGGPKAAALGGVCAAGLAGAAHWAGFGF